jgi:hypothetical protein
VKARLHAAHDGRIHRRGETDLNEERLSADFAYRVNDVVDRSAGVSAMDVEVVGVDSVLVRMYSLFA